MLALENKNKLNNFYFLGFAGILVLMQAVFPAEGVFQSLISVVVFYVLCPLLFFFAVLKRKKEELFFKKGSLREGAIWVFVAIAFSFLVLVIFSQYSIFLSKYELPLAATKSFQSFLNYELGNVFVLTSVYVFFFGAFVLSSIALENIWKRSFISFVFLLSSLFLTGNMRWEFLPYLAFSYFGAVATLKSGSIVYSFMGQWILIVLLDTFVVIIRT